MEVFIRNYIEKEYRKFSDEVKWNRYNFLKDKIKAYRNNGDTAIPALIKGIKDLDQRADNGLDKRVINLEEFKKRNFLRSMFFLISLVCLILSGMFILTELVIKRDNICIPWVIFSATFFILGCGFIMSGLLVRIPNGMRRIILELEYFTSFSEVEINKMRRKNGFFQLLGLFLVLVSGIYIRYFMYTTEFTSYIQIFLFSLIFSIGVSCIFLSFTIFKNGLNSDYESSIIKENNKYKIAISILWIAIVMIIIFLEVSNLKFSELSLFVLILGFPLDYLVKRYFKKSIKNNFPWLKNEEA